MDKTTAQRTLLDRIASMLENPDHPAWQGTFRNTRK